MEYHSVRTKAQGVPYTNKDAIFVIPTVVYAGIVGQTYAGFENLHLGECPILTTDNHDQIQTKMDAFGAAYVAATYPTI
jgi:hypothetical protein